MRFRLLHLSDLHFGTKCHWSDTKFSASRMLADLKLALGPLNRPQFDAVAISGDFTWQTEPAGFNAALEFVTYLRSLFGLEANRVLMIPGNHDVSFGEKDDTIIGGYRWRTHEAALRGYRNLETRAYGSAHDSGRIFDPERIILLGLDSCRIIDPVAKEIGWVGCDQVAEAAERLRIAVGASEWEKYVKIAIFHHHPIGIIGQSIYKYAVPDEKARVSYLEGGDDTLRALGMFGFNLVLHGHQHEFHFIPPDDDPPRPPASGSASLGLCWEECQYQHGFQILEFEKHTVRIQRVEAARAPVGKTQNWRWHSPKIIGLRAHRITVSETDHKWLTRKVRRHKADIRSFQDRRLCSAFLCGDIDAIGEVKRLVRREWKSDLGELSDAQLDNTIQRLLAEKEEAYKRFVQPKNNLLGFFAEEMRKGH